MTRKKARTKHRRFNTQVTGAQPRPWKLPIVMLPWGEHDLARLNNTLHRAIRRFLLKTDGARCSACGFEASDPRQVAAHEVFTLNERKRIQTFITYRLLCKDCHYLTHNGYWGMGVYRAAVDYYGVENYLLYHADNSSKRLTDHFCRVNDCTPEEAFLYAKAAALAPKSRTPAPREPKTRKTRTFKKWRTDWSALEQYRGKLGTSDETLDRFLSVTQAGNPSKPSSQKQAIARQ